MINLRYYQKESVDATFDFLCNRDGNALICHPTGAGKSVVIAELARRAVTDYGGKVIILQHRKELIEQNAAKVRVLLPEVEVGIFSAGLGMYDRDEKIICAGIQSVYKNAHLFAPRNLVICDECHLIPNDGEGMYRTFLGNLEKSQSEGFRVVGLTATPFRTGEGKIYGEGRFFSEMVYNSDIIELIDQGFLCDMKSGEAKASVDTSNLHRRAGEFIAEEVEELFSNNVTVDAVNEIVNATIDRHSVMIFATSVKHACYIENLLHMHPGVSPDEVGTVFGNTSPLERASTIAAFVDRRIKFLVNVDVLTTGFDAPCIDAIAILRATASPGLYAQIVGRGLRTHNSKADCIVLDFGQNIKRHGSIDRIRAKRIVQAARDQVEAEAKEKQVGVKECPKCEVLNLETILECECGYVFPVEGRHNSQSESTLAIVGKTPPQVFDVIEVEYSKWSKPDKPDTMRVDYRVSKDGKEVMFGMSEWICFDHTGYARKKAEEWWSSRSCVRLPNTTADAITMATLGATADPTQIVAEHDGKYWTIKHAVVLEKPNEYEEWEEPPF
jgi:DNA repair protein RadD